MLIPTDPIIITLYTFVFFFFAGLGWAAGNWLMNRILSRA